MTNLDIWAIEFNKKELDKALSKIKKGTTSILYTNCISELKIGEDAYISKQYDTCIYNSESDLLILIMRDDKKSNQKVRNYLDHKEILYHEVRFADLDEVYEDDLTLPKLWFAKDEEVLKNAIKNSKQKGVNNCSFYPLFESELILNYQGIETNTPFDGRIFKGLVKLSDKYVFIINHNESNNMDQYDVVNVLFNQGMNISIPEEKYPQELLKEKGSKVLCKKI